MTIRRCRIERRASREEFLEFVIHRSAYQLKEADPHSWAIPRLWGPPKAALIRIQADEYAEGIPERVTPSSSGARWRPSASTATTGPTSRACPG